MHSCLRSPGPGKAAWLAAGVLTATLVVPALSALGTGQSFTSMQPGFEQELFGVVQLPADEDGFAMILGGLAFAPDGDVWAAECVFNNTRLYRFDKQVNRPVINGTSTLHAVSSAVATSGGCGLTNHPDGFLYSNSIDGVYRLDASTGLPAPATPMGPAGNGLGIAVDSLTNDIVYAGNDCHPQTGAGVPTCTILAINPTTGVSRTFAQITKSATNIAFVDGIYFDPSAQYLFLASRSGTEGANALSILRRPTGLPFPDNTQLVQNVPMSREPDGVAFYSGSSNFVVTLDEDGGTMTRFDFPGNSYMAPPTESIFAAGGFRGDLLQVGADGCIYATQGRDVLPDDNGTRYDDGTMTTEDSVVRICTLESGGGFAETPGTPDEPVTGRIGDFVWYDTDRDGVQDAGEPGIAALVTLKTGGGAVVASTTSAAGTGLYEFTNIAEGSYVVEVTTPVGLSPTVALVGNPASDSNGSPAAVTVSAAQTDDVTIDFGFVGAGRIGDFVWSDLNGNGVQDSGEPGLVTSLTLKTSAGVVIASTSSTASGAYQFGGLPPGSYIVEAATPAGYSPTAARVGSATSDSNGSPAPVTLSATNINDATIDFGFVMPRGSISGFAYKDYNRNGVRDTGEPGLEAVSISLTGTATGTSATVSTGSYTFASLASGSYQVSAPASAGGLTRSTASPIAVPLAPGQNVSGIDFGYVSNTPLVCFVMTYPQENPFRGTMTYTASAGLKTLVVTKNLNNNFNVTIQSFTVGTTAPVLLTGRLIDPSKAAQLIAVGTDMFGATATCDPVVTTVVRDRGREEPETYTDLPEAEHMVTIENNDPGLRGLDVIVNGRRFDIRGLKENETVQFSVKRAMQPGNNNVVILIARGRPGGSAVVTIAEPTRNVRRRR